MDVEVFFFATHDWVPNNARLPVILYRHAIAPTSDAQLAAQFEDRFALHGWPPQWRDGIYDYDHYHSTAHEVLGVANGRGVLMIGGPRGEELAVKPGDALLLPAGTGHKALSSSDDFLVVGAYPEGQHWDICREAPSEAAQRRMSSLPFPKSDPLAGSDGPLIEHWK